MASPDQGSVDIPIQVFGGLVSQYDPQTLPPGASPFCSDVAFSGVNPSGVGFVAGVAQRPGMQNFYATPFAGNPTIDYIKTFIDSSELFHLLNLDGLGILRDESPCPTPPGVPSTIAANIAAASIAQSDTLFGQEWLAFSSPTHPGFGISSPVHWDGTIAHPNPGIPLSVDRVSQDGPGAPPTVQDWSYALTAIARAGTTGVITATLGGVLPAATGLVVGQKVTISGVTADSSLNGTFIVASVALSGSDTVFTAWSAAGVYQIQNISRVGGTVTATLSNTPATVASDPIVIGYVQDDSFDGLFTVATISGNVITWAQAGVDASSVGGQLYTQTATYAVLAALQEVIPSNVGNVIIQGIDATLTFIAGSQIVISGNTESFWNTTFNVLGATYDGRNTDVSVDISTSTPAFGTGGIATSSVAASTPAVTGVAGLAGSIGTGLHLVSVSFVTRSNYITKPAPFGRWYAAGGFQAIVSNIPTPVLSGGFALVPNNVTSRILIFTPVLVPPALIGPFFYFDGSVETPSAGTFPSMVISDVSTTTYTVDFSETALQLGTAASNLFNLLTLGECASVISYANRTFWSGERNKLSNLVNTRFVGGFNGNVPLGWTIDPTNGAGGAPFQGGEITNSGGNSIGGNGSYQITGNNAIRGMISQTAYQDYLGVPIIEAATGYSVRVYANGGGTGALKVELYSPSLGSQGIFSIPYSSMTNSGGEFIGVLCLPLASIPADLVIRLYADGTPTFLSSARVTWIEVFPTNQPYNNNLIRVSYIDDPESFDQTTGFLQIGQALNQSIRAMFQLLDNKLYILTERGLYSTQDDGQNEPSLWTINTVSSTVGTGSIRGVDVGPSWAAIASHDGAYIFWGGEPVKISQEIQPDWDRTNWDNDQLIYVTVDTENKRIHFGMPQGQAQNPSVELVLDYSQLSNAEGQVSAQDIASHPQAYYSVYNPTKVVAPGKARKWTTWNISMNSCALTIRSDGSYHLLRGGVGTGKIYDQVPSQLSDDGIAIDPMYQTSYFPSVEDEQVLQLGSHRKLFKYLTGYALGSGVMSFTVVGAQNQRAVSLSNLTLKNPAEWDFEKNVNFIAERMSLVMGKANPTVNSWWELTKLIPTIQREIVTPVRGTS